MLKNRQKCLTYSDYIVIFYKRLNSMKGTHRMKKNIMMMNMGMMGMRMCRAIN